MRVWMCRRLWPYWQYIVICFFFSSRRRHTRWNCDWSSDVCSSDLKGASGGVGLLEPFGAQDADQARAFSGAVGAGLGKGFVARDPVRQFGRVFAKVAFADVAANAEHVIPIKTAIAFFQTGCAFDFRGLFVLQGTQQVVIGCVRDGAVMFCHVMYYIEYAL